MAKGNGLDFLQGLLPMVKSIQGIKQAREDAATGRIKDSLQIAGMARELEGPSPKEKDEFERSKFVFSELKELFTNESTSPAAKEYYGQLMEKQFFGLPEGFRQILVPLAKNTPLDADTRKMQWFEQNNKHLRSDEPILRKGDLIETMPKTEEYASNWADYQMKQGEYNYAKMLFIAGEQKAEPFKPPKYVQPIPWVGEGENRVRGDYYTRDAATGGVKRVPFEITQIDESKAAEWGWTPSRMMDAGFVPTGKPISGSNAGEHFEITTGRDLKTGAPKKHLETYGQPKLENEAMVIKFQEAFGAVSSQGESGIYGFGKKRLSDKELAKITDPVVRGISKRLSDITDVNLSPAEYGQTLGKLNEWVGKTFPNFPYKIIYNLQDEEHPFLSPNTIEIDGSNWGILPANRTITLKSEQGPVTLYRDDKTGKTFDQQGVLVPEVQGLDNEDELPASVTIKEAPPSLQKLSTSAAPGKTSQATGPVLGDVLNQMGSQSLKKTVSQLDELFFSEGPTVLWSPETGFHENIVKVAKAAKKWPGYSIEVGNALYSWIYKLTGAQWIRDKEKELVKKGIKKLLDTKVDPSWIAEEEED